jgi:hypothetical protein
LNLVTSMKPILGSLSASNISSVSAPNTTHQRGRLRDQTIPPGRHTSAFRGSRTDRGEMSTTTRKKRTIVSRDPANRWKPAWKRRRDGCTGNGSR